MSTTYDIGKVACTPKGAHIQANTYEKLDIVTYGGETYMAVQNVPANITIDNTTYWLKLVVKGAKGDTGDAAGFGTPTITASGLPAGSAPTATITASGLDTAKIFAFALGIPKGDTGATGKGITSIAKTSTAGLVDTYTITYTDSTTSTFTVTNGTSELESTTGQSTVKGMTQKAISDELSALNEDITQLETDLATQTRINTKQEREIANLRQQAPADTVVNYPDTTYGKGEVPTSVCKYAEVNKINGCSRVWSQLLNKDNFPSSQTINGVTYTNNGDGSITVNGTASATSYIALSTDITIIGHKFLLIGAPAGGTGVNGYTMWHAGELKFDNGSGVIFTSIQSSGGIYIRVNNGTTVPNLKFIPQFFDLTLLYGSGNEPTTVAQFKADYPLPYYAYNAGEIKSSTLTAFNSRGVNIWDEEWEAYGASNIKGKNFCRCNPSTTYYLKCPSGTEVNVQWFDENKSLISYQWFKNNAYSSPANAYYFKIALTDAYGGTTYNHDIQICLNSVSTKTTYHPYNAHSTNLPQAITLKSAGNAKDEYVPSTGAVTRNIGMVDLGSLNWSYASGEHARFYTTLSGSVNVGISIVPNMVCQKYNTTNYDILYNHTQDKVISHFLSDGIIAVYDSAYSDAPTFKTAMNGVILYYELATPTSESVTPIDDFIEVEAEGEMSLTHTETPAMDSRFTVTYANLS